MLERIYGDNHIYRCVRVHLVEYLYYILSKLECQTHFACRQLDYESQTIVGGHTQCFDCRKLRLECH